MLVVVLESQAPVLSLQVVLVIQKEKGKTLHRMASEAAAVTAAVVPLPVVDLLEAVKVVTVLY